MNLIFCFLALGHGSVWHCVSLCIIELHVFQSGVLDFGRDCSTMNLVAPSLTLWQAAQKPGNDHRHKLHFYHRHHQPCHHRHCQFHHLCDRHYLQCFFLITKDKVSPSDWSWLFAKKQMIITGYVLYKRLAHWPICNSAWFKPVEKDHAGATSFIFASGRPSYPIHLHSYLFLPLNFSPKNLTQKIWRFRCYGCAFVLLCLSALSYTEPPLPLRSPDKVLKIMEKLGHFMTSNLLHRPAFVWVCFVQGWTDKTRATLFNCVQICSHCKMLSGELLIT